MCVAESRSDRNEVEDAAADLHFASSQTLPQSDQVNRMVERHSAGVIALLRSHRCSYMDIPGRVTEIDPRTQPRSVRMILMPLLDSPTCHLNPGIRDTALVATRLLLIHAFEAACGPMCTECTYRTLHTSYMIYRVTSMPPGHLSRRFHLYNDNDI